MATVTMETSHDRKPKQRFYWLRFAGFGLCVVCFIFHQWIRSAGVENYVDVGAKPRVASLAEAQNLSAEQAKQRALANILRIQWTNSATPAEAAEIAQQVNAAQAKANAIGRDITAINIRNIQESLDSARALGAFDANRRMHQDLALDSIVLSWIGAIAGIYSQKKILQVKSPWLFRPA